jgi:hypothetical protein
MAIGQQPSDARPVEPEDQPRLRLTKGVHLGIRTERIGLSRM